MLQRCKKKKVICQNQMIGLVLNVTNIRINYYMFLMSFFNNRKKNHVYMHAKSQEI